MRSDRSIIKKEGKKEVKTREKKRSASEGPCGWSGPSCLAKH
jgi:hypothetical protein